MLCPQSVWQKGISAKICPALVRLVPPELLQSWKRDVTNSGTGDRPGILTIIPAWPEYFLHLSLHLISQANMTQHCQIANAYLQWLVTNRVFTLLKELFWALAGEGSAARVCSGAGLCLLSPVLTVVNEKAGSHRRDSSRNPGRYCYDKQLGSG